MKKARKGRLTFQDNERLYEDLNYILKMNKGDDEFELDVYYPEINAVKTWKKKDMKKYVKAVKKERLPDMMLDSEEPEDIKTIMELTFDFCKNRYIVIDSLKVTCEMQLNTVKERIKNNAR